ncbi:MAG TPA: hypothetical protein VJW23_14295 [Propionibacteriaceae bacterium]|nr:hypothetical protein [Propionibacteriaceae bacterium]
MTHSTQPDLDAQPPKPSRRRTINKVVLIGTGSILAVIAIASFAGGTTAGNPSAVPAGPPSVIALPPTLAPIAPPVEQPPGPKTQVGDGTYDVGTDIAPGRYHTNGNGSQPGYAKITNTKTGSDVDTIFVKGPGYVTLKNGQTVQFLGAGEWELQKPTAK